MSQEQFSEFMADQCKAIEESGEEPEQWVIVHAEEFRKEWEEKHYS
jgi:hypothetical protein